MLRIIILTAVSFILHSSFFIHHLQAQCPNDNVYYTDLTPTGPGDTQTDACTYGGEYNTFTACAGAEYTIATCGNTNFDTQITIYEPDGVTVAGFNDDGCGVQSTVTFTASVDGVYNVVLDEFNCLAGTNFICMTISVTQNTACSGGGCSDCSNPTPIGSIPFSQSGLSTCGACNNFDEFDACASVYLNGDDYVFTYTPSVNEVIIIDITSPDSYTGVFVMDGCPSTVGTNCVGASVSSAGDETLVTSTLIAGTTYYIVVSSWPAPQCVSFDISITSSSGPPNQSCADAIDLCSPTTVTGTTQGAQNQPSIDPDVSIWSCNAVNDNFVFYTFTTDALGSTVTLNLNFTCANSSYLQTAIFESPPTPCVSSLDWGSSVYCSESSTAYQIVASGLLPNTVYYIVIDQWPGNPCDFTMQISGSISCGPCAADAGTTTVNTTGNGINNYILCVGDEIDIISNNDFTLPPDGCVGCLSELMYAVYNSGGPTGPDPDLDPNWTGFYWTGQDFDDGFYNVNDGGSSSTLSVVIPGNDWCFVPITADDGDDDASFSLSHDQDGDGCFDMGTPICFTYLNPITFSSNEDCSTGSVDIQISGGYPELFAGNYNITNTGSGTLSSTILSTSGGTITISGLNNGDTYSISVTDDNGCPAVFSGGPFAGPPDVSNTSSTDETCNSACDGSASVAPSGGTPPYTYQWDANAGNQTTQTATGLCAGNYTVTVTDANNCTETATVTINQPALLTIDIPGMVITGATCGNSDGSITGLTVTGGTTPYTYIWEDAGMTVVGTNLDLTNVPSGIYTLTATDANGCTTSSGPYTVNDAGGPVIDGNSMIITNASCGNSDGSITGLTVSGGTIPYTYAWEDAGMTVVGTTLDLPNVSSGSYTLTVTDANGCVASTGPYTINDAGGPVIDNSGMIITDATCGNSDGSITGLIVTGGTIPYTYAWEDAGMTVVGTNLNLANLPSGSYTLTVTDANGCIASTGPYTVNDAEGPVIDNSGITITDATCGNSDGSITGLTVSGGTTSYTYAWEDTGMTVVETTLDLTNVSSGSYTLTVSDANGCISTAQVIVAESNPVAVNITGNTVICSGDNAVLDAGSGFSSYLWSTTETTQTITVNPTMNTTYSVLIYSGSCPGSDSVTVFILPPPQANITGDTSVCSGESVLLQSDNAASYVWLFNDSSIISDTTQIIYVSSSGNYQVVVTNACGTDTSSIKTITIDPLPSVDAGEDTSIAAGNSVQLSGSGGPSYSWSPSSGLSDPDISNPVASPTKTTTYHLTITDANGCSNMASVIITVTNEVGYFIPDIFSPNGDGENDVFYVYGKGIRDILFIIFDRWGEKVYEAKEVINNLDGEIIAGWDGTFRSKPLDPAVFVYYLEANDGEIIRQGNITLVR
ncbi:MAG: gliding motility-associated C-terminal domain-containing protein [Bacteroidota bacterium]